VSSRADIVIEQGTDFSLTLNLMDDNGDIVPLAGYSPAATMRRWYTSRTSHSFGVTTDPSAGTITLTMPATETALLGSGRHVYDVELTDIAANVVTRVLEGIVTVSPSVTKTVEDWNNEESIQ